MWLDRLKELKKESGLSFDQIAKRANVSEKTVERIFEGKSKSPYADTLDKIATAFGTSLNDILADTKAVVGTEKLATLQESVDVAKAEIEMLKAENKVLTDNVSALNREIDLLRMQLSHKDEIIRIHDYYGKLLSMNKD